MKLRNLFLALAVALLVPAPGSAEPPEKIRIQGTISQLGGVAVVDDVYQFSVALYEQLGDATPLITMTAGGDVSGGAYSLLVGPDVPGELFDVIDDARYVEITVVGNSQGPIGETLTPRQQLASVPFALNASGGGGGCTSRGRLRSTSTSTMVLEPELGEEICLRIDGGVARSATAITFDMATDLEPPQVEAADRFYYLYLSDESGVLTPHISETVPDIDTASPSHGHHPTQTGWRFVQAVRNDLGQDVVPFAESEPGRLTIHYRTDVDVRGWPDRCGGSCSSGPPGYDLPDPSGSLTTIDFSQFVPVGASEGRFAIVMELEDDADDPSIAVYGGTGATTVLSEPADTFGSAFVLRGGGTIPEEEFGGALWWIPLSPVSPALTTEFDDGNDLEQYRLQLFGWAY